MSVNLKDFMESLEGTRDWRENYEWIEFWAVSGEIALLGELAQLLESPRSDALTPLVREAIFDHIEMALALTPDLACAEALFQLAALPRSRTIQPERMRPQEWRQAHLASLLASGQKRETLLVLFAQQTEVQNQQELLACLGQEMVVRHMDVDEVVVSRAYAAHAVSATPRLAWLPLALVSGEEQLARYLPQRRFRGSSCAMPFGPTDQQEQGFPPQPASAADFTASEIGPPSIAPNEAVANWIDESNGKAESRVFATSQPVTRLSATDLIKLGLDCLQGAVPENVHLRRIPFTDVLCILFSAAANGGAYNSGLFAAYGRLAGWRSVAGLVGAGEAAPFEDVAALADKCVWFLFDAASTWFYQVAWDVGITVLRPDGRSIAVLAATDTD